MRILIIEDEHKIAQALKEGLEDESYAVDISYNAEDGLSMTTITDYDLIILDRMLPGDHDGIWVARSLREKKNHTPILMLTAKGELEDKIRGLDSGVDDYLIKPFAFEELLARMRALLRRPKSALSNILSTQSIELNTRSFSVTRFEKEVKLSKKEFSLLEYFMRHQGQTLSKETIIEHVWDYDADILPNTVEAYVKYLRTKLEKPFKAASVLHTVHGFGYKFEEKA